jgi:hypothetical protein
MIQPGAKGEISEGQSLTGHSVEELLKSEAVVGMNSSLAHHKACKA